MNALTYLVPFVMVAAGSMAYLGSWRSWARNGRGFGTTGGFGLWWMGTALLLGLLAPAISNAGDVAFAVLVALASVNLLIGFVGLWWLPPFLLPGGCSRAVAAHRESTDEAPTP